MRSRAACEAATNSELALSSSMPAAADFYRHFGFHDLDERRLLRRLTDIAQAVGDQPT
jgi:Holliday junction resolvasome RuvABC DNA-binding subunit